MKLTEDWLSVLLGFGIILLAVIGVINPDWFKF